MIVHLVTAGTEKAEIRMRRGLRNDIDEREHGGLLDALVQHDRLIVLYELFRSIFAGQQAAKIKRVHSLVLLTSFSSSRIFTPLIRVRLVCLKGLDSRPLNQRFTGKFSLN